MNQGLYWAPLWQPLAWRGQLLRTTGSRDSGRAGTTPTDFCCWGHDLSLCESAGVQSTGDSRLILSRQLFLCHKNHISESWDQEIEKDVNFSVAAGDTFEDQPLPLKTTVHFHQFSKKFHWVSALPWCIISDLSHSVSH